jgi:hypothetical protein
MCRYAECRGAVFNVRPISSKLRRHHEADRKMASSRRGQGRLRPQARPQRRQHHLRGCWNGVRHAPAALLRRQPLLRSQGGREEKEVHP